MSLSSTSRTSLSLPGGGSLFLLLDFPPLLLRGPSGSASAQGHLVVEIELDIQRIVRARGLGLAAPRRRSQRLVGLQVRVAVAQASGPRQLLDVLDAKTPGAAVLKGAHFLLLGHLPEHVGRHPEDLGRLVQRVVLLHGSVRSRSVG